MDALGCVIRGEVLRRGHREKGAKNQPQDGASRVSNRDRKSTMVGTPVHADAQRGFDALIAFRQAVYDAHITCIGRLAAEEEERRAATPRVGGEEEIEESE